MPRKVNVFLIKICVYHMHCVDMERSPWSPLCFEHHCKQQVKTSAVPSVRMLSIYKIMFFKMDSNFIHLSRGRVAPIHYVTIEWKDWSPICQRVARGDRHSFKPNANFKSLNQLKCTFLDCWMKLEYLVRTNAVLTSVVPVNDKFRFITNRVWQLFHVSK